MNQTETPEINIGRQLKCRREELGYSLAEVAEKTHIRKVYLEKIEGEQFADLPGKTYVVGFVRSYANFLGLSSDPLIEQLEKHFPNKTRHASETSATQDKYLPTSRPNRYRGLVLFIIGLTFALLLGGGVYWFMRGQSSDDVRPATSHTPPPEQKISNSEAGPEKSIIEVEPKPESSAVDDARKP